MGLSAVEGEDPIPPIVEKKPHIGWFLLLVLMALLLIGWVFFEKEKEAETKSSTPAYTSTNTQNIESKVNAKKTFSFDVSAFVPEIPPETNETRPINKPPPPRKEGNDNVVAKKAVFLIDRSRSPLMTQKRIASNNRPSRAVPQEPAAPSLGGFDLFGQNKPQKDPLSMTSLLTTTDNPQHVASRRRNRDYWLAKGDYLDCVLNTRLNSTVPGMTKCTLTRNIYSDNGNTLLLERGSEITGEYRANITQGQNRLFVLWDRVKTPHGVIVNLASPGTGSLGDSGLSGDVDNHFWQRFGGAMMLSLVDDVAAYAATNGGANVNNFSSSSDTAQSMAAEALKNTINIAPTFYKNQGERIGIFIARDIDFSSVYQLKETP